MKPINILLVEDNEGDIILITEALEEGKICNQLQVIKNGWAAIEHLNQIVDKSITELPDLIILDVNLPKMNGHEALKKIKENDKTRHIPVIMLTTSSDERDIYLAYRNYANCYITKPIEVSDFLKVIISIENFWISIVQLPHQKN